MAEPTKITLEGEYQTRDGRPVRVLCVDALGMFPVITLDNHGNIIRYRENGRFGLGDGDDEGDIIPVPKRHKRTVWVNVYPDPIDDDAHPNRDLANHCADTGRIACLKLDLDFAEGEGL